jgi:hypothetical protein
MGSIFSALGQRPQWVANAAAPALAAVAAVVLLAACTPQSSTAPYTLGHSADRCQAGPSGDDLLALVHAKYGGTHTPPAPRPPDAPPWMGAIASGPAELLVAFKGGRMICTPAQSPPCPANAPCAAPVPATVSIELAFVFATQDGSFTETFMGTSTLRAGDSKVLWSARLPASKTSGSYPFANTGAPSAWLFFSGSFANDANTGGISQGHISEITAAASFGAGEWLAYATGAPLAATAKTRP